MNTKRKLLPLEAAEALDTLHSVVRSEQSENNQSTQTAIAHISAVGAVQKVAPKNVETTLFANERGINLESGEIKHKNGSGIVGTIGWLNRQSVIPLAGLSTTDSLGDVQQRLADASRLGRPLDGGGGKYELNLGAHELKLGNVTLQNAHLEVTGTGYAVQVTGQRLPIASGWGAAKGETRLTIVGHGCVPGDVIQIESSYNWNPARAYYKAGQSCYVIDVIDGNTLYVSEGMRFDFNTHKSTVYRIERNQGRGGLSNVLLDYIGDQNTYGVRFDFARGRLLDNVELRGFRTTGCYVSNSFGIISGYSNHDTHYTNTGTSYGLAVIEMSDVDVYGCHITGGRHAIAHGGNYPTVSRIHGGALDGGRWSNALDAHGGVWSMSANGVRVVGGCNLAGYKNSLAHCYIRQDHNINAAVYAFNESPEGASVDIQGCHIVSTVPHTLRIGRRTEKQDGTPLTDVWYDSLHIENTEIHNESPSSPAILIDVSLKRFSGNFFIKDSGESFIKSNRIKEIDLKVHAEGAGLSLEPTIIPNTLTTASNVRIDVICRNVNNENTSALRLMGAFNTIELSTDVDGVAGAGISLIDVAAKKIGVLGKILNSGIHTTNNALKSAVFAQNTNNIHFHSGFHAEGKNYGVYVVNSECTFEGVAYLRGGMSSLQISNSTVTDRSHVREAVGTAHWPTLAGSTQVNNMSIGAGTRAAFTITVSGASLGDVVHLGPPASLGVEITSSARVISANTVQVVLWNHSTSPVNHSGTWNARVSRC